MTPQERRDSIRAHITFMLVREDMIRHGGLPAHYSGPARPVEGRNKGGQDFSS